MEGHLFIRIGEFDHSPVAIRPSQETNPKRKVVPCKSRGYGDSGNEHQKGIQMRDSFAADVRRIHPFTNQCWLVLDRLVDNGI